MAGNLELSDQKFNITMITLVRDLMGKVDKMQEQIRNGSRKMKIPKKELKGNARQNKPLRMNGIRNQECLWESYQNI